MQPKRDTWTPGSVEDGDKARDDGQVNRRDRSLAARIQLGDARAFDEVVLGYSQTLTSFVWRYVRDEDTALDIVQDTFVRLWESRAGLSITSSLRAYLFAAARNRALNAVAHADVRERHARHAVREAFSAASGEGAEYRELREAVEAALATLPPRAREIVRLRWVDQLSKPEIASVLGISAATVSVHLTRSAKRLRRLLERFRPGG